MTDRVSLLMRFGDVPEWLANRVRGMTFESWRIFYDRIEAGDAALPKRLEDTMPRNADDLISNPNSAPDHRRADEFAKWEAWKKIWGLYPWEEFDLNRKRNCRPRMAKFRD